MGLWVYEFVVDRHRARVVDLFSRIEIGDTRAKVDEIFQPFALTSGMKRVRIDSWEKYFVWAGDDWIVILDYTNEIVEFAGVVSSDQLSRRPKGAPLWKQGTLSSPRLHQ